MRKKLWRDNQTRMGLARRRRLEYRAVADNLKRRKDEFVARLQRRLVPVGNCLCYQGTLDQNGYARLNVSFAHTYNGKERVQVTIGAHRLFLILKLGRPIRRGFEAGHTEECEYRTCVLHVREEHYKSNCRVYKDPPPEQEERMAA